MPSTSKCFVPGCNSGYKKDSEEKRRRGERSRSLFEPPKDKDLFKQWENRLKRADRSLTLKDKVCDLHFEEKCILKYFETKMPDGKIERLERGKWELLPGAIPTKLDLPQHLLPREQNTRKARASRNDSEERSAKKIKGEKEEIATVSCDFDDPADPSVMSVPSDEPLQIDDLLVILSRRGIPFVKLRSGSLMVLHIDDENTISKRIVIDETMMTEVYFGKKKIVIEGHEKMESTAQFDMFLTTVDSLNVCPNAYSDWASAKYPCRGFHTKGKYCLSCSVSKRGVPILRTAPIKKRNKVIRKKEDHTYSMDDRTAQSFSSLTVVFASSTGSFSNDRTRPEGTNLIFVCHV